MGAVYEAEHIELQTRLALKVLQSSLCSNEIYRKRFLREARAASAIESRNVIQTFDFGITEDNLLYFTMELLDGEDFEQFLKRRGLPTWSEIRPIVSQVLDALHAAHSRGVIHRDIKPSNCFLCEQDGTGHYPVVKVLDFGIAKITPTDGDDHNPIATIETLTATNELFGTVAYMAPELIEGVPAGPRSDIYAVGVMMFRALTGQLPFTGTNAYKILQQHVGAPIPSLRSVVPDLPAAVESVVFRALAKHPAHRYQSIEELQTALANAERGVIEPSMAALIGRTEAISAPSIRRTELLSTRPDGHIATSVSNDVFDGSRPSHGPLPARWMIPSAVSAGIAATAWSLFSSAPQETPPPTPPPSSLRAVDSRIADDDIDVLERSSTSDAAELASETSAKPLPDEDPVSSTGGIEELAPPVQKRVTQKPRPNESEKLPKRSPARQLASRINRHCPSVSGRLRITGWIGLDGHFTKVDRVTGIMPGEQECVWKWVRSVQFERGKRKRKDLNLTIQ